VDAIYMDAVVTLTGHGGWPMTVFLTPEGEPFYGGTYFPPEPRHGMPSFRQVLEAVSDAYRERPEDVARSAGELVAAIGRARRLARRRTCSRRLLLASMPCASFEAPSTPVRRLRARAEIPAALRAGALLLPRRRRWLPRRSTAWRPAACTTSSAAASTATRSTSGGSCPTSRRCSTTTRCSCPRTCTAGSSRAASATARSSRRQWNTCSATSCCPKERSPPPRTPTRTASRG
jgi:hypothetical protein